MEGETMEGQTMETQQDRLGKKIELAKKRAEIEARLKRPAHDSVLNAAEFEKRNRAGPGGVIVNNPSKAAPDDFDTWNSGACCTRQALLEEASQRMALARSITPPTGVFGYVHPLGFKIKT